MEDPEFAVTQLAQTTMRSELGMYEADKFVPGHLLPVGWEVLQVYIWLQGGDGVVQGEWEVVGVFLALLYIVKHVQ